MIRHLNLPDGEAGRLFQTLVRTSPDAIVICGLDGRVQYLSEAGQALFGVGPEDLDRGLNLFEFIAGDEDAQRARFFLDELFAGRPSGSAEYRALRKDKTVFWNEANANVLTGMGGPDRIVLILRDISERKASEESLRQYAKDLEDLNRKLVELSTTDPLTGLLNRRQLGVHLELERARAERSGREFSLALIDIDLFKALNDHYGHLAGDQVLTQVSAQVRSSVRRADLVFRYGGDELLVLLPDTTVAQSLAPLEKLRMTVSTAIPETRGRSLPPVTISIGVAGCGRYPRSADELIEAADRALYRAKADGRDRVVLGD